MMKFLDKYNILLASNSPRRQELLAQMGVKFSVIVKQGIDESFPVDLPAENVPEYLANKKAKAYISDLKDNDLLITSDTVVVSDGKIIGKPHSEDEAREMISSLSGRAHTVYTGVAIYTTTKSISFTCDTKVYMSAMTDELINYYVEKYKPLDKAGAYGIQEWIGLTSIHRIEGSFQNVMGLPTQRLFDELSKF
ncbi:MAG: Maf family nucleotide pyrophosphatase [Bacteroidia bacterium]|nr:Maf family nucleotide pyrophosphatase [Bacteroidia bacterium]